LFWQNPDRFTDYYVGGTDNLHPDGDGYAVIAQVFLDAIEDRDGTPPVIGRIYPEDGDSNLDPLTPIELSLFDFDAGIAGSTLTLEINGELVVPSILGDPAAAALLFQPLSPLSGEVSVLLGASDQAVPPHSVARVVTTFTIADFDLIGGDLDRDGRVDASDIDLLAARFGAVRGEYRYRVDTDIDRSDRIDGLDLALLASNFGRSSF
jgi:hypothetical protein